MTEKPTSEELEQRVKELERENTGFMHIEASLRESEEKFSKAFHCGPIIAGISDIETGKYIDVNQTFYDKLGFTPEEVIGKKASDVVRMNTKFRDKVVAKMKSQGFLKNEDMIIYTKTGTPMNVSFFAEIIELAGKKYNYVIALDSTDQKQAEEALQKSHDELEQRVGERTRELTVTNDSLQNEITDRKWAREALQKEKNRAQQYLDIVGVMFVAIDLEQNVTMINKKGCEILGSAEHEIIGKNWFDHFLKTENVEDIKSVFNQTISGKNEPVEYYENEILIKDGRERIIAWYNSIIRDESGRIIGTLSSGEDITLRKQAEEVLNNANIRLEEKVKERTVELEEKNTALKVLLDQRGDDKKKLEEAIMSNVKELLMPNLNRLKKSALTAPQETAMNILEANLNEIISPFSNTVSSNYKKLSPTEIQVANFIKHGATSKDIAKSLGLSYRTIETHRYNIRKKVGISGKSANLRTYLVSERK